MGVGTWIMPTVRDSICRMLSRGRFGGAPLSIDIEKTKMRFEFPFRNRGMPPGFGMGGY